MTVTWKARVSLQGVLFLQYCGSIIYTNDVILL